MRIAGRNCRVKLGHLGRVRCEPGWRLGADWAARLHDFDLWFVWAGSGTMRLKTGDPLKLAPGTGVWMRPGRHYEAEQVASERLGVSYIHFDLLEVGSDLPLSGFAPPFEVFRTRQVEFVDTLMRRVIELSNERFPTPAQAEAARQSAAGLFQSCLHELVREHATHGNRPATARSQGQLAMMHLAARIREDPARTAGVAALARANGFSTDHFSRRFKQATGLAPEAFVITAKMDRARRLLEETSRPVGEIARNLGFQDIYYFSRQFKQKTGRTPTAWRRHGGAG